MPVDHLAVMAELFPDEAEMYATPAGEESDADIFEYWRRRSKATGKTIWALLREDGHSLEGLPEWCK